MTESTVVQMGGDNSTVNSRTGIVTAQTWCRATSDIAERYVIDIAVLCQLLIRMAIQTIGRGGALGDRVDDLLS